MNTFLKSTLAVLMISSVVLISSCKEDPELPDNLVEFESDQLGIGSNEGELTINISLSREASAAATITAQMEGTGVEYGTDYTTEPAAVSNAIAIPIAVGATSVSFTLKKVAGALFDGDEQIIFTLPSAPESLVLGQKAQLTLSFAEIVAASGAIDINGGGATYPNKVFIDFSANRQTAIARTTWDFGFSTGSEFRVILNSSNGMMAKVLDKSDLNAVTAADTAGLGLKLSMEAVFAAITSDNPPNWVPEAISWIDDPTGDLTKTSIASISATASENKVYIVNRGSGPGSTPTQLGWKKIRIVRNGNGYTLQHADIAATTFSEIQITKNESYSFQYVSMTTGAVVVEPTKERWDIAWTAFSNSTNFGSGPVPYYFQDITLQNTVGVQTVQVLTSTISYEAFAESNIAALDFGNQSQAKIGSSWRSGGGPGSAPAIRTDRFYVVRDSDGNYYKVKFTALSTGGERGKPKLEFALVKKGS